MKTNEKLISVIIPVYNTAKYLPRCLDSILKNTYKNLEIICIDDGSTDESLAILHTYADRDKRVKVVTQTNGGVSSARNQGLNLASGFFISFVDSDDWVHHQYFEALVSVQEKTNAQIVNCGYSAVQKKYQNTLSR